MVIQHNLSAINTHRQMGINNRFANKNLEKLSSGFKINRAADNAAGLAISEKMRGQIRGLGMAENNVTQGVNLIQSAEGGLHEISSILGRIRELSVQAANGTYMKDDREHIDKEVQQLLKEVTATAEKTTYNTMPLLTPQSIDANSTPSVSSDTPLEDIAEKITNKSDIVIALDISGSMGSALDHIINNIKFFVDNVPSGSRVAVLLYSDVNIGETMQFSGFSTDPEDIKTYLDNVSMYGGGDAAESGLEAIVEAVEELKSSTMEKHIVFITDAPSHTSDDTPPLSTYSNAEVNQLLKDENVVLHGIGPTSGTAYDQIKELVDGTSGDTYDVSRTLNPSAPTAKLADIVLQIGANKYDSLTVKLKDMSANALGITGISIDSTDNASSAISVLDDAIVKVLDQRAYFGAQQNRLEHTLKNLGNTKENLQAAESSIRDVDMAKEMMEFTKNNIIAQAAQSMLSQANQLPQGVMGLLQ